MLRKFCDICSLSLLKMNKLLNIKKQAILFAVGSLTVGFIQKSTLQNLSLNSSGFSTSLDLAAEEHMLNTWEKLPSLGFRNVTANYMFLEFLSYFGDDEVRSRAGYKLSPDFFETIIRCDPYFKDFYIFLSQSISVYAGLPDKAVELMNGGVEKLAPNQPPDGYHIWRYKGVDELLFAGDSKAAQYSFEKAASWAAQSDEPDSEAISQMSQQTAQFLATDPDSKQAQISAWSSVLIAALDDETRTRAVEEIRSLGGNVIFGENGSVRIENTQAHQNEYEDSDS